MKHFLILFAASAFTAPLLYAGAVGGGFMDDFISPYDDTAIELPGEKARKPSVSRSAQLVDDSSVDSWGTRDNESSSAPKSASSTKPSASSSSTKKSSSSSSSTTKSGSTRPASGASTPSYGSSFTADGVYIPYSERHPEVKESSEDNFDYSTFDPDFNPFTNNYKYKDTNYQPNRTRPEFEETRRKIKDILGDGVPKVMADPKVDELIHNAARDTTLEAPTTPNRWDRAPNGWFCDYDDAMAKAQQSGKAVAVFFHSSDKDNSRKFKSERMENAKFKNKMSGRLLVVYLDYPDNAETSKDRRNKEQVQHNRRIADQFHVSTYPTLIILDSSGTELGRITDAKNNVSTFIENADRIVPQKQEKAKNSTGFRIGGNNNSIGMGESGVRKSSN